MLRRPPASTPTDPLCPSTTLFRSGLDPAVAGDDAVLVVDQDRVGEAEAGDAVGDLADLLLRMGPRVGRPRPQGRGRSEEQTSELQSLMRISYAVFCLKKKKKTKHHTSIHQSYTKFN